jgi:hypothetical protein
MLIHLNEPILTLFWLLATLSLVESRTKSRKHTMQAVTIKLPNDIYEQLQRTAELTKQPLDIVVAQSLSHSLSPLLEEIPVKYQQDVFPLLEMDDKALQDEVENTFPEAAWAEYETLLQQKKERSLNESEQARLNDLHYKADLLTLRKAYAAVLLKRRGHRILPISELPLAQ